MTPANAPLAARPTPAGKLLTALFISAYYTLDLNWTLICSSVTFHQPWHVVFDIPEQPAPVRARLAVRFRWEAGEVRPPLSWLRAWHAPLSSPLASALHLQSASRSLMSQHTSHPIRAAFNDAGLPHTCQHTHTHTHTLTHTCSAAWSVALHTFECENIHRRLAGVHAAVWQLQANHCFHYQLIYLLFSTVVD